MSTPLQPPRVERRPAFTVVGTTGRFTVGAVSGIEKLWDTFIARQSEIRDPVAGACYGVCTSVPGDAGDGSCTTFDYTAGLESRPASGAATAPEGMVVRDIPEQTYLVFTYRGHVTGIAGAFDWIWRHGIPASGRTPAHGPEFELYDHRFCGETGSGEMEIWIPVT